MHKLKRNLPKMQGLLLLGNYMGTSSTQEFTYAEVVHAVYCYPHL